FFSDHNLLVLFIMHRFAFSSPEIAPERALLDARETIYRESLEPLLAKAHTALLDVLPAEVRSDLAAEQAPDLIELLTKLYQPGQLANLQQKMHDHPESVAPKARRLLSLLEATSVDPTRVTHLLDRFVSVFQRYQVALSAEAALKASGI